MENGAVYRSTTEAHPGPARGARSGLVAYFNLRRLKGTRLIIKLLQLVSPRPGPPGERRQSSGSQLAVKKRPFPHLQLLPSPPGEGPFPSGLPLPAGAPSSRLPSPLGPRRLPRTTERVWRAQEMRQRPKSAA